MPQNEDELELKVGDIIEVVGEVSRSLMEYIHAVLTYLVHAKLLDTVFFKT